MRWCRGSTYDIEPEMNQLEASIKAQSAMSSRFSDLFGWWALKPFLLAMGLMLFQQMSGTNNILFYMAGIFEAAGSDLPPLISSLICNSVKVKFIFQKFIELIIDDEC
jgi:Sugar (and other) transporter